MFLARVDPFHSIVRGKISTLIEHWQRICILAERIIKRREAAAVRLPFPPGRTYTPAHFHFPPFSSISPSTSASSIDADRESLASSIISSIAHPRRHTTVDEPQADTARLTNTLKSLVEVNDKCWRGDECELCSGVSQGLGVVAQHTQKHADVMEDRVCDAPGLNIL